MRRPSKAKLAHVTHFAAVVGILVGVTVIGLNLLNEKIRNKERQTDVKALHAQIEYIHGALGFYPSLDQLNDPTFRKQQMDKVTNDNFRDPQGQTSKMSDVPLDHQYAYTVEPRGCDNLSQPCLKYVLTATLEGGALYTRQDVGSLH